MEWLEALILKPSVAHSILLLAVVIVAGMSLGKIKIFGISLGMAGALFAGILLVYLGGLFGMPGMQGDILLFCREFGLILFVYTIGMQVGPGFLDSMKREGLPLNLLAVGLILTGVLTSVGVAIWGGVSLPVILGLYSGATTNTPSLGAGGQAAVQSLMGACGHSAEQCSTALGKAGFSAADISNIQNLIAQPGSDLAAIFKTHVAEQVTTLNDQALAVSYPFGILGVILVMLAVRFFFNIKIDAERKAFHENQARNAPSLNRQNISVRNPNVFGKTIDELMTRHNLKVVISRIHQNGETFVAGPETILGENNVILAVGSDEEIQRVLELVGEASVMDLRTAPNLSTRTIIVTRKDILGKRIDELQWEAFGAVVTRITRGEFRLLADPHSVSLHLGDVLRVVGDEAALDKVAKEAGNSEKQLAHPEVLPLFLGISIGVIFGSIPFFIPGVPAPVKLGLAGGPMLIAIMLARFRKIGPMNFFLPLGANLILREIGIVFFLACVGIKAGESFFQVLLHGDGMRWMALGVIITLIPVLVAGIVGRKFMKLNYLSLMGVLSGSMTSPPTLAYANSMSNSDAPSIAYASVYPLTMLLRILTAQLMAIFLLVL